MDSPRRNRKTNELHLVEDNLDFVEEIHEEVKGPLAILWDIENCCIPNGVSPEEVAGNIRKSLHVRGITGPVTTFSAYGDFSNRPRNLREGCQRNGVNLIDVPNGRKDAADKAILVDMFLFALDNAPPSTILLISGDVDFAVALNKLGQRGYTILVAVVNFSQKCSALWNAAKFVWKWPEMARSQGFGATPDQLLRKRKIMAMEANGDCGLPFETIRGSNPNSPMQPSDLKLRGIDALKDEVLSLLHMNRGMIMISEVRACYEKAFKKQFSLEKYGYKLKQLLEELGNNIYVTGWEQWKYLCLRSQINSDASKQYDVIEMSVRGLPFEMTTESNLTSSMQPSNIGPGDWEMTSEITTQLNPSSSIHPCNIRLADCEFPSETTAESNPTSLMQLSEIVSGDYGLPSETAEANQTSLVQPSKISPSDCRLPSETTDSNPTSLMLPNNISLGDCGFPYETTEPNTTSLMQPSYIRPSDCWLPSEIMGKLYPTCLMNPWNIRLDACVMPSQKTKSNQTLSMEPSNIRRGQGKHLFLHSQNNSNASKQNNTKGLQARKDFKKKKKIHQGFRVKGSKPIKRNEFKGSTRKQGQQNQRGRLQVRNQNEGQRIPNHQQKNNGRNGKNGTQQNKNINGTPSQGKNENQEITSRKGPMEGCFICGGNHYASDCPELKRNDRETANHQIHVALHNRQVDHHATFMEIKEASDDGFPFETTKEDQSRRRKEGCYKCNGDHYARDCPALKENNGERANHQIHVALDNRLVDHCATSIEIKEVGDNRLSFETKKENRSRGRKEGCYECGGDHYARDCPELKTNDEERGNHQIHVALDNRQADHHATFIEIKEAGDNRFSFETKKENQSRGLKERCYKCCGHHYVERCHELKRNGGEKTNHQIYAAFDNRQADHHATSIEIKEVGDNGLPSETKKENRSRGPKEGCFKCGGDHYARDCLKFKRNGEKRGNHQIHVALGNQQADHHATCIEIKEAGDSGFPFESKKENQSRGPKEGCYKCRGDHHMGRCRERKSNGGERENHQIHAASDNQQADHQATPIEIQDVGDYGLLSETKKSNKSRVPKGGCYKCGGNHYEVNFPEPKREMVEKEKITRFM